MVESGSRSRPRKLGLAKVKTGCVTCKARRVKCGEEKPACQRCIKYGISCGGYRPPKPPRGQIEPGAHPSTQPRPLLPSGDVKYFAPKEIIEKLFETQQEHDYFKTFCTKTVFDILPSFQSQLLRQTLLQACASSASIRSAVSALGALDKTSSSFGSLSSLSLDSERKYWAAQHHQNALKQYSQAVKRMRADSTNERPDLRIALLTCLVIMCFEAWNGNHQLAVNQISLAFKLIKAWKQGTFESELAPTKPKCTNEVEEDLILAFSRLDVQVISLAQEPVRGYSAFSDSEEIALLDSMPLVFESIDEAEKYEDALVRRVMRFLTCEVGLPKPAPTTHAFPLNGWWGVKDPSVVLRQQQNIAYYKHWFAAVDPLWNKLGCQRITDWWTWRKVTHEKPTPQTLGRLRATARNLLEKDKGHEFERAAMYRMHLYTAWTALITVCAADETEFDAYTPMFAEIVEICEYLLERDSISKQNSRPKFSFDSYVVIPLHMVGQKCRDPMLRRRVVTLLHRYPRREGVWDSLLIVRVIEWVMSIEEENMEQGYIPNWARLHGIQIKRDMEKKTALLKCDQRVSAGSGEVVERAKIIVW